MLRHKRCLLGISLLALLLLATGSVRAEKKSVRMSQGNNLGLVFGLDRNILYGGGDNLHQFPRGSGNMIFSYDLSWGPSVAHDLNGDGVTDDTTQSCQRGMCWRSNVATLEAHDQIEALWNAGENLQIATSRIEVNRIWSSLDADDIADWPVEFREGRSEGGAPIIHGAETIVGRFTDTYEPWIPFPSGASLEYSFYFLNFAESNNMVYGHLFIRNMSEYIKWTPLASFRDRVANTPNGQTWETWTMTYQTHSLTLGSDLMGWIYNPAKAITGNIDADGLVSAFSPPEAPIIAQKVLRQPSFNGETMELTNTNMRGTSAYGFDGQRDIMETGFPVGLAFRAQLGEPYDPDLYPGQISPWTGKQLFGWPGRIVPDDPNDLYHKWLWGRNCGLGTTCYGALHNFAPRDSTSMDFVLMFVPVPAGQAYQLKTTDIGNILDPGIQEHLKRVESYADVAATVFSGGYILPETPVPPQLTIIPGDRQVTVTWSDVNVQTPDAYYFFLQANPELDPEHVYREYDLEGYRLYRSFVGPSDSHSELIDECSMSAGNLHFYFVDRMDDDTGLYRMRNGARVWYALVPFDRNIDPVSGQEFSLPGPGTGKVWNRPGEGLFNVIPRSEASNFKPASINSLTFTHGPGTAVDGLPVSSVKLAGDGNGRLLEAPKFLMPPLREIALIPVNNERITADLNLTLLCSREDQDWGCRNKALRYFDVTESTGKQGVESPALKAFGDDLQIIDVPGPMAQDGMVYTLRMTFENMSKVINDLNRLNTMDAGGYTGGSVSEIEGGCGYREPAYAPNNLAYMQTGRFKITWKDAGGGYLTVEVQDETRSRTVSYSPYLGDPERGWGFWTVEGYGGRMDLFDSNNGNYWSEWHDNVPLDQRTVRMEQRLPADNTEQFALWVNGQAWLVNGEGGITMPQAGTVWTLDNAYGEWNNTQTEFTQYPDLPAVGDKWQIQVKAMSLDPNDADLGKIKVVPNPYLASSFLDLSPSSRRIEFVNLPDRCTIRIYTLSGNLVNVLNHVGANRNGWGTYTDWDRLSDSQPREFTGWDNHGGTEPWNLRNRFGATVASGLYIFHVTDSRGKSQMGKFYIIE
ncbi:hypothetical protein LLH00_16510 [bacterium]|nr:hypothetical protein [bacterium]